jgi:oligopeptide transport system ATP-binding protein
LFAPPVGCAFAARCAYAMEVCYEQQPEDTVDENGHIASCWLQHPLAAKVERPAGIGGRE